MAPKTDLEGIMDGRAEKEPTLAAAAIPLPFDISHADIIPVAPITRHPSSVHVPTNNSDQDTCISELTDREELFRPSLYPSLLPDVSEEEEKEETNHNNTNSQPSTGPDTVAYTPTQIQQDLKSKMSSIATTAVPASIDQSNCRSRKEEPDETPRERRNPDRTKCHLDEELGNLEASATAKQARQEKRWSRAARGLAPEPTTPELPVVHVEARTLTTTQPGAFAVHTPMTVFYTPTAAERASRNHPTASQSNPSAPEPPARCFSATLSPPSPPEEDAPQPQQEPAQPQPQQPTANNTRNPLVEGTVVVDDQDKATGQSTTYFCYAIFMLAAVIVIVALAIGLAQNKTKTEDANLASLNNSTTSLGSSVVVPPAIQNDDSTEERPPIVLSTRLDAIRSRGVLRCAYTQFMLMVDPTTGVVDGFNSNWCTAIAAAIWGPENARQRVQYMFGPPFAIDNSTHIDLSPVVHGGTIENNAFFTRPMFYDARRIGGERFFVEHCAEQNNFKHIEECQDLQVCIFKGNLEHGAILADLPERKITSTFEDPQTLTAAFVNGECNLFFLTRAGFADDVAREYFSGLGYQGDYTSSETIYGVTAFSLVTTTTGNDAEDAHWTDFVNSVIQSLLAAEQHNVTHSTWDQFPQTQVFGPDYQDMFRNAIQAVGNYGEIFQRYISPQDRLLNHLNNGTTGLIQSLDLHALSAATATASTLLTPTGQESRPLGKNLQKVVDRGLLLCGVQWDRPGFATNSSSTSDSAIGMDVDYCRALSAALFSGNGYMVELVHASHKDGFQKLTSGEIDVLAGSTWNLQNDVREPSTGLGFAFSQPYFYGTAEEQDPENLCMATMQDDKDWGSFVYFIVAATMYAERQNVNATAFNQMPLVDLYGPGLKRMFRDAIFQTGNYGEIYSRNLEIPRSGRNLLDSTNGPQFYPLPGYA